MELTASLSLVRPEIILSFSALALLLLAAWMDQAGRLISILAVAALGAAAAFTVSALGSGSSASAFDGLMVNDAFGNFSKLLIYIAAAVSLTIAPRFLEKAGAMRAEYPVLIVLSCVGMGSWAEIFRPWRACERYAAFRCIVGLWLCRFDQLCRNRPCDGQGSRSWLDLWYRVHPIRIGIQD
jgi:hypothetical protein